jgi:hypothetical protein
MRNKLFVLVGVVFIALACSRENGYSAELSDLDGTWIDSMKQLTRSDFVEREYTWGKGKRIVNGSLEFDLNKSFVLIPGDGGFTVNDIVKADPATIHLRLYRFSDEDRQWPVIMKFHFESNNKFWIDCPQYENWISVGKNKPWYRLSGPER